GEADAVEARCDVWTQVAWLADLVQQLRRYSFKRHRATGAGMLGDHTGAVATDLRDGKPRVPGIDLGEKAVVAARRLGTAFEHVAGNCGPGQRVPIVPRPAEMRGGRADHQ